MRFLILAAFLAAVCGAYKMVLIAPNIAKSQVMFNKRVAETLAKAGHDVTVVLISTFDGVDNSAVKIDKSVKIHYVNASVGISKLQVEKEQSETIFEDLPMFDSRQSKQIKTLVGALQDTCRNTIRNKEFMTWLRNEKFDLAFAHMYHACPVGIIHAAGIPSWIWLNSGSLMDFIADIVGVPTIPSYVPPGLMETTDVMNFYRRTKSFIGTGLIKLMWPRLSANPETAIFREELDPSFPDLIDLGRQCPLVMVNSNELYELPRPTLAKVISIGGIGAQNKDAKPLPEEFESLVSHGEGAVLMSFGSVAAAHEMPSHWKSSLLSAFARLPQYKFLVRYESDDLNEVLPPNVHLFKWMPQTDLLQHPRVKAFISHGGYNSLQEVITAGKPLITIALFGDQPKNSQIALKHGISIPLSKSNITEDSVFEALSTILHDSSYAKKAQRLRDMARRRPIPADLLLVRWAEFAAEFGSLENMQPAGQKLNFIQYHSIDVMLALAGVFFALMFIVYKTIKCIVRRVFCRKVQKNKRE